MTTMKLNQEPFAFNRNRNMDDAFATVAEALDRQHVMDTTAGDLHAAGLNILALSQRAEQSREFDVAGVCKLVNTGFSVDRLNEALTGDTPTCDVDTAVYHMSRDARLVA
jgi:hypothetical protein